MVLTGYLYPKTMMCTHLPNLVSNLDLKTCSNMSIPLVSSSQLCRAWSQVPNETLALGQKIGKPWSQRSRRFISIIGVGTDREVYYNLHEHQNSLIFMKLFPINLQSSKVVIRLIRSQFIILIFLWNTENDEYEVIVFQDTTESKF